MPSSPVDLLNRPSRLPLIAMAVSIPLLTIAALACLSTTNIWPFTPTNEENTQLNRALIETIYGDAYRTLPATPDWAPLRTLHARHPALQTTERLAQAFAAKENGYVLVGWVESLPPASRQDFLYGLDLVIDDARVRGEVVEAVINRFRGRFVAVGGASWNR